MGAISFTELITDVGGETSNSYGTLDELKAYFAHRDEAASLLLCCDCAWNRRDGAFTPPLSCRSGRLCGHYRKCGTSRYITA